MQYQNGPVNCFKLCEDLQMHDVLTGRLSFFVIDVLIFDRHSFVDEMQCP